MKAGPLTSGYFRQEKKKNLAKLNKQMTAPIKRNVDAIEAQVDWDSIDWKTCLLAVRKLQLCIARWAKVGNWRKVKALQWLLT